MTSPKGYHCNKFVLITFIVTAASFITIVAGFGSFQIKPLSLSPQLPSNVECSHSNNDTSQSCQNTSQHVSCPERTLHIKACLSHHQLPLPRTLQCTLGQELLTLPFNGTDDDVFWKNAVMTIPFSYSWPGGYTLSVTATHACPPEQTKEMVSSIIVADYIYPYPQWTSFLNQGLSSRQTYDSEGHSEYSNPTTRVTKVRRSPRRRFSDPATHGSTTADFKVKSKADLETTLKSKHVASDVQTARALTSRSKNAQRKSLDSQLANAAQALRNTRMKDLISDDSEGTAGSDGVQSRNTEVPISNKNERSRLINILSTSFVEKLFYDSKHQYRRLRRSELESSYAEMHKNSEDSGDTRVSSRINDSKDDVDDEDDGDDAEKLLLSTSAVIRAEGGQMLVAVRVMCKANYYGKGCSRLCRARDDLLGHYRCSQEGDRVCLQGWGGEDCREAVCSEHCLPSRGFCSKPDTCTCRHGWYGEHCERCRTRPGCVHGRCHLPGQCVCHRGWVGPLCDVEELFCLQYKPCQNGGTCLHDQFHNYTCSCPAGYTGTHCEVPLCHDHFCLHGGQCQIAEGTRYCLCKQPFTGPRCQHRMDVTNVQNSILPCHGQECVLQNHPLQAPGIPSQTSCVGANCENPLQNSDSCLEYMCYNEGKCVISFMSSTPMCECVFPFTGPQCLQARDPCDSSPCRHEGHCITNDIRTGSFECDCKPGYSGVICDDVDETSGLHTGSDSDINVCDENVICQNGGKCQKSSRSGRYFCECFSDFTGEFCEIDNSDPCSMHVCLNGGTCTIDENNEPICICDVNYSGSVCQNYIGSVCLHVVCQNGGTCIEHDAEFVCACRNRYEGRFCEKRFRRKKTTLRVRVETSTQSSAVQREIRLSKAFITILEILVGLFLTF